MNNPTDLNRCIQAAGTITIIFGVLTALLPAAWVVVLISTGHPDSGPPIGELSLTLLVGVVFVLLGWGVLCRMRLCAALAGGVAAAPLTLNMLTTFTKDTQDSSIFFLVLSASVLGANWLAWREIGRLAPVEGPTEALSPVTPTPAGQSDRKV